MALACSSESRQVPSAAIPWRGSAISSTSGPTSRGRPGARHQLLLGIGGTRRAADQIDHLVDVGDGDGETDQHVGAVARLAQQVLGAAADDLLAEGRERLDQILEVELLGTAAVQRDDVGAERGLQIGEAPELVQHDVGDGIALQLDDDAHALAVALVPQVGDALDPLLAHQLGDLLDQHALVHLVGDGRDDERLAILADLLRLAPWRA